MMWPFGKRSDPFSLLKDAASAVPPGYHNSKQMLEDFRAVFFGDARGKRVFNQIMVWGGFFRSSVIKSDPHMTYFREGERNMAARVWAACIREIEDKPDQTKRRRQ